MARSQILLTNDDGVPSPGLWAAAASLSEIGFVHVVAPREQLSGMGRSFPRTSDGVIKRQEVTVNGRNWEVYSVGGTPAQTVLHAVLEILPEKPDLVVSGINYGENLGTGVTASGTVGAALEAASLGIPALAISLETEIHHHLSYSEEVDFSTAAHFARSFGEMLLTKKFPADVEVLKVDIPCDATPETPWQVSRLSRLIYFESVPPDLPLLDTPRIMGYRITGDPGKDRPDSDVYVLRVKRKISVTPLSMDLTSRVDLDLFEKILRS